LRELLQNFSPRPQAEAKEKRRREENAKKAKEAASQLFPGEKWEKSEYGIYVSPRLRKNDDEMNDAKILRDLGSTVYLVPESSRQSGKKYDAIVNGEKMEFKNVGGNANTLIAHFLKSRSQAPNVFINLETSNLTRREIVSALYGARNSDTHTDRKGNINQQPRPEGTRYVVLNALKLARERVQKVLNPPHE
jgi:hypothetical protein